jgi:cytochrome o ubiquinol oxidase operon protein cyoD
MATRAITKNKMSLEVGYSIGYGISILLTAVAYILTLFHVSSDNEVFTHPFLIASLLVLAIGQFIIQVIFFLHLSFAKSKRWNLILFLFMVGVVSILALGSLWIMYNLNYHHIHTELNPTQTNNYVIKDEGVQL